MPATEPVRNSNINTRSASIFTLDATVIVTPAWPDVSDDPGLSYATCIAVTDDDGVKNESVNPGPLNKVQYNDVAGATFVVKILNVTVSPSTTTALFGTIAYVGSSGITSAGVPDVSLIVTTPLVTNIVPV